MIKAQTKCTKIVWIQEWNDANGKGWKLVKVFYDVGNKWRNQWTKQNNESELDTESPAVRQFLL